MMLSFMGSQALYPKFSSAQHASKPQPQFAATPTLAPQHTASGTPTITVTRAVGDSIVICVNYRSGNEVTLHDLTIRSVEKRGKQITAVTIKDEYSKIKKRLRKCQHQEKTYRLELDTDTELTRLSKKAKNIGGDLVCIKFIGQDDAGKLQFEISNLPAKAIIPDS